jgi:hypothetical protein
MALFKAKQPLASAPDSVTLQSTLDGIEAILPTLASDYEHAAYEQSTNPSDFGQSLLDEAGKKLREAEDRKRSLTAAIAVAKVKEAEEYSRAQASTRKSQINSLRARLRNRDDVVVELTSALSDAAAAWDKLNEVTANIDTLMRELGVPPDSEGGGWLVSQGELKNAFAAEIGRVARRLPTPVRNLSTEIEKLEPLADAMARTRDGLMHRVTGEKQ